MKTMNLEIRKAAKDSGVRLWEIAMRLGITDGNFSRRLRSEFSTEERERVLRIISEIAAEKGGELIWNLFETGWTASAFCPSGMRPP